MNRFRFSVIHSDTHSGARLGEISTPHGIIHTPAFVPVGTQATVKSLSPDELQSLGVELFFVNTYHTYLRPGIEIIKKFKGLHGLMNWNGPLITDSGGFQVFSLGAKRFVNIALSESATLDREKFTQKLTKKQATIQNVYPDDYRPVGELVKIDEEGVTFTSHWDGTTHRFTPEISIALQHALGSDIMIAFDECPPYPTPYEYAKSSMERTHRWALQSIVAHRQHTRQALYGVLQGSIYEDLRISSAKFISDQNFSGVAIGGVAVGESKSEMKRVLDWVAPHLPVELPRHLLGVGEIDDIFDIVEHGIDTFDCVQPTRLARMGRLFTRPAKPKHVDTDTMHAFDLDITKKIYEADTGPIEKFCTCYTCSNFSRAYLHHLFRVHELLAYRLATIHNLHFTLALVSQIRTAIGENQFLEMKKRWLYTG